MPDDSALDVLTVEQAAAFLRISRGSCYQAIREGTIPSFRIGRSVRVLRTALLNWIASQQNGHGDGDNLGPVALDLGRSPKVQTH